VLTKLARGEILLVALLLVGCLSYRLTADQVVQGAQLALQNAGLCHATLDIELDTDLLKDSISIELWQGEPGWLKVQVLSAQTRQLVGLAFATDGEQSISYSKSANEVLLGPADMVRMPSVIEQLVQVWKVWLLRADPQQARLVARERDAGLVVYKIEIPLEGDGYAHYWIDAGEWLVRQLVYHDDLLGAGKIIVRELSCTEYEGPVPDVRSALELSAGIPIKEVAIKDDQPLTLEEAQLSVSFPLLVPTNLPGDTQLTAAYHLDKNVALIYAGELAFSLVQGRKVLQTPQEQATPIPLRGGQAVVVRDGERGGSVLIWQEDGIQYSIAGALSQEEAVLVAESLDAAFKSSSDDQALGAEGREP